MQSITIEIRAGAGGDEAAIFALDLYKMYSKYALNQGWEIKKIDSNPIGIGGIKQTTFQIKGEGVFDKLKNEGGVHRVQRVPKTEKNNRIHTSTASVAILQKGEEASVDINPNDLRYDYFCSSGKGGQNVNKRQTAIRITHVPSGEVATSQTQRNLEQNKQTAIAVLKARLLAKAQGKKSDAVKEDRQSQIGTADRSEKIRTYNFPQDRITDHRINKSFHNIEKIMDGKIDKMIKTLQQNLNN
ncbi:MAG: PCRF domain-containing protein [Parcubacteria group bacterium]|nr:PCRF domain-containing protein [Parcubacteria group bacterium]